MGQEFRADSDAQGDYYLPMANMFPAIPVAGRDYVLLLEAMAQLVDVLTAEGDPRVGMQETFDNVVDGFGAEKALILAPIIPDPPGGRVRFEILAATPRVKARQLAAIRAGESAEGISASMIRTVYEARQPAIVEHPMFLEGAARTAAFGVGNYSAMCAPVLDSTRLEVRALYYLQNTGPDLTKAYRYVDLKFLLALTDLIGRLFTFHQELVLAEGYPGLSLRDIRARITERVIRQRIKDCQGNYKHACNSLHISRSVFYRMLEKYQIPTRNEERRIDEEELEGKDDDEDKGEDE